MINVLSVENMRNSDAFTIATQTPSLELMRRAGEGIFNSVTWQAPVAIICGSGNNAGDGYVVSKLLFDAGIDTKIFLLSEKFSDDGKHYFDICVSAGIEYEICDKTTDFSGFHTILDCIFGTGFKGEPRGLSKTIIEKINESGAYTVCADINSGLNGDNGMGTCFVASDLTISIGGFKSGHFLNMAKDAMKEKINIDIGIKPVDKPFKLIEKHDIESAFPARRNFSNKSTYGYIALIGGSDRYSGAISLANMASNAISETLDGDASIAKEASVAMRLGAGVVMVATPSEVASAIKTRLLESTIYPLSSDCGHIKYDEAELDGLMKKCKAIGFGMGIGISEDAKKSLEYLLKNYEGRLLIDADGLSALSKIDNEILYNSKASVILTPHNKELSRLTGLEVSEILDDPINVARDYAKAHKVTVLLKGPTTIVTDGDDVYLVDRGCAGMATAGSGDVLSGIITAILGYNDSALLTATAGAYINGLAGELAEEKVGAYSMVASDTISQIANAVKNELNN